MVKQAFASAVVLASIAGASIAQPETANWKQVGDWEIVVQGGKKVNCRMQKTYDEGFLVQFGLLRERDIGYFAVYRQNDWTEIQYGNKVNITFSFDGDEYKNLVTGTVVKPWYGGYTEVKNPQAVYDLAQKSTLKIVGPHGRSFELELEGTLEAVQELTTCQEAQPN